MEKRFAEMGELARLLRIVIPTSKHTFLHDRLHPQPHPSQKGKKKEVKCSIRAYFILKVYQFITETTFEEIFVQFGNHLGRYSKGPPSPNPELLEIIKVGEYCITLMYLENHLHDQKYGIKTEKSKQKNRLERREVSRRLFDCINQNFSKEHRKRVKKTVKRLFRLYYFGMSLEKDELSFAEFNKDEALKNSPNNRVVDDPILKELDCLTALVNQTIEQGRYRPIEKQNFFKRYITRSFLINGIFFHLFAELLIKFYGTDKSSEQLIRFSQVFGLLQQLVNDTFDYLPYSYSFRTASKYQKDTFADARNQLMTLPIICYFNRPKIDKIPDLTITQIFENGSHENEALFNDEYQLEIAEKLLENRAISQCRSLTYHLGQEGREILNGNSQTVEMLNDLFSIGKENKFFKNYGIIYKEYVDRNRK